uniref:Uncharacterized protein n=1 Tax=Amphimedon queenslandica TaxID=400682 RepID=A0A1X7U5X4_AMPQE
MSVRNQLKWAEVSKNPPYYLVYFKDERTVPVIKAASIVEDSSKLEPGSLSHVKERKVVYDGVVVTSGTKDDVVNVEEQFLNGVYSPDFIEKSSDSSDNDTDWDGLSCENINEREGVSGDKQVDELATTSKRKRNDTYKGNQPKRPKVVMSSVATASSSSVLPLVKVETPQSLHQASSTPLSSVLASSSSYNGTRSFDVDACMSDNTQPPPFSIDNEMINSLMVRIDKLERQNNLCLSQCSLVMNHLFGRMAIPSVLQESPLDLPHNNANKASVSAISHLSPASLQPPVATIRSVVTESSLEQEPVITQASIASHIGATMTSQPAPATPPSHPVAPVTPPVPVTPPILVTSPDPVAVITPPAAGQQSLGESVLPVPVTPCSNYEDNLNDPDEVIRKYPKLNSVVHAGRLAVRLATEAYFGDDVLRKCTVYG